MENQKKNRKLWLVLVCVLTGLVLACIIVAVTCLQVELTLLGGKELHLEYGETYEEPGAKAVLRGRLTGWELCSLEVDREERIADNPLGLQDVVYRAGFLWNRVTEKRMVYFDDNIPPALTLVPDEPDSLTLPGEAYIEAGYTAADNADGDITEKVVREERDGKVYYSVKDSYGNETTAVREINYMDTIPPEITLKGGTELEWDAGKEFIEPGYEVTDNKDGNLTDKVTITGEIDRYVTGSYELVYTVSDEAGNSSSVTRTVTVVPIPQAEYVDPGDKIVYLTFDDGPSQHTARLLDILDKYNVKATFFVVDTGYASMIGEEYRRGHSVAVHTACHVYDTIYASEDAYFADFNEMSDIIYNQTGMYPTMLRFPGGSSNTVSRFNPGIMSRLADAVENMGYQYYDWNVSSGDAGETTDTEQVFLNVIEGISSHNKSIVLQHDIKGFSVDAVEKIIIWGLEHGYTFLPLTPDSPTSHHGINN